MGLYDLLPPDLQAVLPVGRKARWSAEQFPAAFSSEYRRGLRTALESGDTIAQELALENIRSFVSRGVETKNAVKNDRSLMNAIEELDKTQFPAREGIQRLLHSEYNAPPIVEPDPVSRSRWLFRCIERKLDDIETAIKDGSLSRFIYIDGIKHSLEVITAGRAVLLRSDPEDAHSITRIGESVIPALDSIRERVSSAYLWKTILPLATGSATVIFGTKSLVGAMPPSAVANILLPAIGFAVVYGCKFSSYQATPGRDDFAEQANRHVHESLLSAACGAFGAWVLTSAYEAIQTRSLATVMASSLVSLVVTLGTSAVTYLMVRFGKRRIHTEMLRVSEALNSEKIKDQLAKVKEGVAFSIVVDSDEREGEGLTR